MWAACFLSCVFLRFRFFLFLSATSFVHAVFLLRLSIESFRLSTLCFSLFHFLVVFPAVSRWLVRGLHQTTLPPLETLLQSHVNNLLQETPPHLTTHLEIPLSFQTGLRGLRPLNLTNCNQLPHKPTPLYALLLTINCCTQGLLQPC